MDVRLTGAAQRKLTELNELLVSRVTSILVRLGDWPVVSGVKPLRGKLSGRFQISSGEYGVQFYIGGQAVMVEKLDMGPAFTRNKDMPIQTIKIAGHEYVLMPKSQYHRLQRGEEKLNQPRRLELPPLPEAHSDGTYPAIATGRAILARKIMKRRWALGWLQAKLAREAGVWPETLNRIEKCRVAASLFTVNNLVATLARAECASAPQHQDQSG